MSEKPYCTIHQRISSNGMALVRGSEVRMPDGTPIPGVKRVETVANGLDHFWRVTIELEATFGDPIIEAVTSGGDPK